MFCCLTFKHVIDCYVIPPPAPNLLLLCHSQALTPVVEGTLLADMNRFKDYAVKTVNGGAAKSPVAAEQKIDG